MEEQEERATGTQTDTAVVQHGHRVHLKQISTNIVQRSVQFSRIRDFR